MSNVGKAAIAGAVGYFGGEILASYIAECLAPVGDTAPRSEPDGSFRQRRRTRMLISAASQAAVTAATFAALD